MSDTANDPRPGDVDNVLLQKILKRLPTISGGSGSTGLTDAELRASPVPVSGPLTDTQLRASAVPISAAALPLPSGAATEASLAAINGKITAVNTGAVVLAAGAAAIGSVSVTGTVTVAGNIGGKTTLIKDTTAVSTTPAYTAGDAVGGKRTIANALTSVGTGVLESIHLLDRANQSLGLTIYIFDADPSAATITDNAAFVFSTDDLKVIAVINVATTDWTTSNSKAMCSKANLGIVLKSAGTSLYAAIVVTNTPTFAATSDLQVIFGILQD